ncbi:MAG: hypothetical protein ACK5QE_03165 [Sphingobacteriia bacterium]|jgi:cell shape-determining protein MreD
MNQLLRILGLSLLILFIQAFLLKDLLALPEWHAYPKLYPLIVLMLPLSLSPWVLYVVAFVTGLLTDVLLGWPLGGSSFCLVLLVVLRTRWILMISRQSSAELLDDFDIERNQLSWQLGYLLPLLVFYELIYNLLIDFGMHLSTLYTIVTSSLMSVFWAFVFVIMVFHRAQRR